MWFLLIRLPYAKFLPYHVKDFAYPHKISPLSYRKDFMYAVQINVTQTFLLHIMFVLRTLQKISPL